MKKFLLILFLALIFLLAGCSGKKASDLTDSPDTDSSDTGITEQDDSTDTLDNDPADNETPDNSETQDSEKPGTETPDTEATDTETQDNEVSDTDTLDNGPSDDNNSDSGATDNDASDPDTQNDDSADNDAPDGDTSDSDNDDIADADIPDNENQDSEASDPDTSDDDIQDNDTAGNDSDDETPDADVPATEDLADVFNLGPYEVKITDIASGTDGAPRDFRIYEPKNASGNIPVVHFQHDFLYKKDYYDGMLTHLASHGFIVVSGQSDHAKINGESSIKEAGKVVTFISWLKENIQSKVSVTADIEHFGVAGHGRGGKVTSRVTNYDEMMMLKGFFGVDPVDAQSLSDPGTVAEITTGAISKKEQCLALGGTWSLASCKNVTIDSQEECEILGGHYFNGSKCYNNRATLPSMFLGTEKGRSGSSACAPAGENSTDFYASYPSPSHHIIAAGVGHADMVDPEDLSSCGSTCSGCTGSGNTELNQKFVAYTGGLMVAFFNTTLKDKTQYEALLNDVSTHPFLTTAAEHK